MGRFLGPPSRVGIVSSGIFGGIAAAPGAHQFVAVGTDNNRPLDTTPVTTIRNSAGVWTPHTPTVFGAQGLFSVAHATGQWLAGSSASAGTSVIATSPDAVIWTAQTNPLPGMDMFACGGDAALGVFGGNTADLMDSVDGINWNDEGNIWGGSAITHAIAASGAGLYAAVAGTSGSQSIAYNIGSGWPLETTLHTNNVAAVIWDGSQLVALDIDNGNIIISPDGPNWSVVGALPFPADNIAFNGHVYVLTSTATTTIVTASTLAGLVAGTPVPMSIDTISVITAGGGVFVAIDFSNNAYSSPDGVTWTTENTHVSAPFFLTAIAYA